MAARRVVLFIAAFGLLTLGWQQPAGAAATQTVALYELNEAAGARVLVDSSGNRLNGTIGAEVTTAATYAGATGHRFPNVTPNVPPARPEHINNVPHDARLNPGTADFAFTIRMRTTRSFGNVIQKGQSSATGGYFKMENPAGVPTCLFRGADGSRGVSAGTDLSDGEWHTIRCERTATGVSMTVDGTVVARLTGPTGSIANNWPLSIGGKYDCDQVNVTCDYFVGDIDWVRIETQGTPDTVAPTAPGTPVATSTVAGQANIAWAAATDDRATSLRYLVFRDSGTTAIGTVDGGTTGTIRFTDTGRTPGAVHTYRVRASDGTNTGPRSAFSAPVTIAGTTTTTTTTTTTVPNRPPVGSIESITVDGSTITVQGPASDPNGAPVARVEDVVDGRRTLIDRSSAGGRYTVSYTGAVGTHQVCVSLLDSPTRTAVPIGCGEAVVK
jgi:hypothetical protein